MDAQTLAAYDRDAAAYAADWHAQPPAADLHAALRSYFRPGPTADVGCGSGRDTAWLNANGFPAVGYDASEGLLLAAQERYPNLHFAVASLPELAGVADASFANVLCETVIMHLPSEAVAPSIRKLLAILAPGGTLYLSWRVTMGNDTRDGAGRLYAALPASAARDALSGAELLLDEERSSASSGKTIHRIVARVR